MLSPTNRAILFSALGDDFSDYDKVAKTLIRLFHEESKASLQKHVHISESGDFYQEVYYTKGQPEKDPKSPS